MGLAHWDNDGSAWDLLVLGQYLMPGLWDVDFDASFDMDVKKGKGVDGARVIDHGHVPCEITLTGRLHTPEDWEALQKIMPALYQRKTIKGQGAKRAPLDLVHPKTTLLGIQKVYVISIAALKIDKGILSQVIKCLEWIKPTPKPTLKAPPKGAVDICLQQEAVTFLHNSVSGIYIPGDRNFTVVMFDGSQVPLAQYQEKTGHIVPDEDLAEFVGNSPMSGAALPSQETFEGPHQSTPDQLQNYPLDSGD